MTREEAIKIIDCYDIGFYDLSGEKIPADKLADAFDMAIEALQAKTDGDLISRQAAIETSLEFFVEFLGDAFHENEQKELIARFQRLPSAEPKTPCKTCGYYNLECPKDCEYGRPSAEDRHYIKIYADDEPSVKAEKLYQICGETQNREVAKWLKEYFPSVIERSE